MPKFTARTAPPPFTAMLLFLALLSLDPLPRPRAQLGIADHALHPMQPSVVAVCRGAVQPLQPPPRTPTGSVEPGHQRSGYSLNSHPSVGVAVREVASLRRHHSGRIKDRSSGGYCGQDELLAMLMSQHLVYGRHLGLDKKVN